jgi:hypothetical protein
LPDPDVFALEIAEELEAALEQFTAVAEDLKRSCVRTNGNQEPESSQTRAGGVWDFFAKTAISLSYSSRPLAKPSETRESHRS